MGSKGRAAARAMLTRVACTVTPSHGVIQVLGATEVPVCGPTTARVCVYIHNSGYQQRQCRCPGSGSTPEAMSVPEGHAAARAKPVAGGHVWSVVLPQLGSVLMSVAHVTTRAHENHVFRCGGSAELPPG